MSLFNPRKDTKKWAAIVTQMSKGPIPEKTLDAAKKPVPELFLDRLRNIIGVKMFGFTRKNDKTTLKA